MGDFQNLLPFSNAISKSMFKRIENEFHSVIKKNSI